MTDYRTIDLIGMKPVSPDPGPAPQQIWIELDRLVIDERYQRPLNGGNRAAIKRIAEQFKWCRFSPVLIAPVEGGLYALIDGQHRAHAAALCGFERIPAMVALVAPEEQALAFIEINTRQIKVTSHQVYRAALTAGEEWAVQCRDAVEAADCQLMTSNRTTNDKKPGQIYCVQLIKRLVEAGHSQAVTEGLAAMLAYDAEAVPNFSNDLLQPWLTAVAEHSADRTELLSVLKSKRPWLVIEAADRIAVEDGKPKARSRREFFSMLIRRNLEAAA